MGSVSDNYRCPLCGRTCMGGYHVDCLGMGPICTEGDYACLEGLDNGRWVSVADFFFLCRPSDACFKKNPFCGMACRLS